MTLKQLLRFAYRLHDSQVSGPGWMETERFDITAKVLAPGLRAVLSDRFKLKFHHETKEIPVYFLVIAKGGPHLRDLKEGQAAFDALVKDRASPFKSTMVSLFKGCDLPAFAERLGRPLDRPVVDKTGIKGEYWFQMEWAPDPGPDAVNVGPSLLQALRDQLGLGLEPQSAPQDILVVDQAERP